MDITKLNFIQKLAEENPLEFYLYTGRHPELIDNPDIYSIEVEFNTNERVREYLGLKLIHRPIA